MFRVVRGLNVNGINYCCTWATPTDLELIINKSIDNSK
jgi:hypothetical protein